LAVALTVCGGQIKPAIKDETGKYRDPHYTESNLAVVYFHADGKAPPQFVCANADAQIRLDVIMAGLMTVLAIETRKAALIKELGSLPAYGSSAQWSSPLVDKGEDVGQ
jgi:hypothetical protein